MPPFSSRSSGCSGVLPSDKSGWSCLIKLFRFIFRLLKGRLLRMFARWNTRKPKCSWDIEQSQPSRIFPDDCHAVLGPPKTSYVCASRVPTIMPPTPPNDSTVAPPEYSDHGLPTVPLSITIPDVNSGMRERTSGGSTRYLSPSWSSAHNASRASFTSGGDNDNEPTLGLTLRPRSPSSPLSSRSSLRLPLDRSSGNSNRSSGLYSTSTSTLALSEVLPSLQSFHHSVASLSFSHVAEPGGGLPDQRLGIALKPISAKNVARYDRGVIVDRRKYEGNSDIMQMTREFTFDSPLPDGWEACVQPEGALYFYHSAKRVLTDAVMTDQHVCRIILECITCLEDTLASKQIEMPEDCEIALELLSSEEASCQYVCGYYFVDNESRSLFWFDTYDAMSLLEEVETEMCLRHMKLELESQYWFHCEMFPNHREVEPKLIQEVQGLLMHATVDAMTSSLSTTPYRYEVTEKMLAIVSKAQEIGNINGYSACVISRLMGTFSHARFLHHYGLPGARLSRGQSIYGTPLHQKSWLISIVSPLLFNSPELHRKLLEEIWVDRLINYQAWDFLLSKLQGEWEHISITSTVMLTVNVGFLAIQSVDRAVEVRSAAQSASYLAAVLSVGSIVMGLILVKGHRTLSRDDADAAQVYLWHKWHPTLGMEILAIMYGLPHGLLMWAMAAFFTALSLQYFQLNPDMSATSNGMRVPFGLIWLVILASIIWFLLSDWSGKTEPFWTGISAAMSRPWSILSCGMRPLQMPGLFCRKALSGDGERDEGKGDVPNDSAA
ncbi:hypothetical protein OE88DRAFT_1663306 [Heliocybe sulcata]|uniref:WW domain-containing protein n=1 Tax=Heliocybe sulcata TaxID=5364 RepID=A0A5C3MVV9_9AGAM|nr:hypothetical protein OE88DRAFT_1663306 [Heliocybe sulcata]